jgi:hypothetical protein
MALETDYKTNLYRHAEKLLQNCLPKFTEEQVIICHQCCGSWPGSAFLKKMNWASGLGKTIEYGHQKCVIVCTGVECNDGPPLS